MSVPLITLGDSISQGFIHGGAARTDRCFSTLLAQTLGIPGYRYLDWGSQRLMVDFEVVFRHLEGRFGADIAGLEWVQVLDEVQGLLGGWKKYFETGPGKLGKPVASGDEFHHNLAVEGMKVADAWLVTPALCRTRVASAAGPRPGFPLPLASEPFYRNAYRVLNPGALAAHETKSPLDWVAHHAAREGVDNILLWLGANNALGTIIDLEIRQSPGDGRRVLTSTVEERNAWNLWHPDDFEAEYRSLLDRLLAAVGDNAGRPCHVFVGTLPLVTIAPLAKGIGEPRLVTDAAGRPSRYYQDYTFFALEADVARSLGKTLAFTDALFIDKTIQEFNQILRRLVAETEARSSVVKFHLVPLGEALTDMAWKRNDGQPPYPFPPELKWLYPQVTTKFYDADRRGRLTAGGVFGLDGVHPSFIGQGLIAHEFLKALQEAGRAPASASLDWKAIVASDSLRQQPLRLIHEVYDHDRLLHLVHDALKLMGR